MTRATHSAMWTAGQASAGAGVFDRTAARPRTDVELGIFARTFPRTTPDEIAQAVAAAGYTVTQFGFRALGLDNVAVVSTPEAIEIREAFAGHGVRIWGLSATFNAIRPDKRRRQDDIARAAGLVAVAPYFGAQVVTLSTGTRDPHDMWRAHPQNSTTEAWTDLTHTLRKLIPVARAANVRLGIEPEPGNVIRDARDAARLLEDLGHDVLGIVLDPANLLTAETAAQQTAILDEAFTTLARHIVGLHAKDVTTSGSGPAGTGLLDYRAVLDRHARLPRQVPVIVQDVDERDARRVRDFLLRQAPAAAPAAETSR